MLLLIYKIENIKKKSTLKCANSMSEIKVHRIPARNGKCCFQFGWLCFTGT